MKIDKIRFDTKYPGNDIEKLYRNQFELGKKLNEVIEKFENLLERGRRNFPVEKVSAKECGFMILTPTPEHGGGMWCAELYPCKKHGDWKKVSTGKTPDFTFISQQGNVHLKCTIHYESGRITLSRCETALEFDNRKVETIEGLAKCMLEAVDYYKQWKQKNVS